MWHLYPHFMLFLILYFHSWIVHLLQLPDNIFACMNIIIELTHVFDFESNNLVVS